MTRKVTPRTPEPPFVVPTNVHDDCNHLEDKGRDEMVKDFEVETQMPNWISPQRATWPWQKDGDINDERYNWDQKVTIVKWRCDAVQLLYLNIHNWRGFLSNVCENQMPFTFFWVIWQLVMIWFYYDVSLEAEVSFRIVNDHVDHFELRAAFVIAFYFPAVF